MVEVATRVRSVESPPSLVPSASASLLRVRHRAQDHPSAVLLMARRESGVRVTRPPTHRVHRGRFESVEPVGDVAGTRLRQRLAKNRSTATAQSAGLPSHGVQRSAASRSASPAPRIAPPRVKRFVAHGFEVGCGAGPVFDGAVEGHIERDRARSEVGEPLDELGMNGRRHGNGP